MATAHGDLRHFQSVAITADAQIDTVTAAGDRLLYLGMRFNSVAAPLFPFSFSIYDGTSASGKKLGTWVFADQSDGITASLVTDFITLIGAKDLGILNLGSGFPIQTGLYIDLTQGGGGTNAVSVTFEALYARKV
jgi:hypothetical protein